MIHRPELLDALQSTTAGPLEVTAWRHMFGARPPDQENSGGARWKPPGIAAIYLSCERHGAIAEGDHAIAVQPYRPRARRVVYSVELTLGNVLDLTNPVDLSLAGLTEEDLASDDHTACREVGAAIDWLEHDVLLVPSARSDAFTLVIYPAHRGPEARFAFDEGQVLF